MEKKKKKVFIIGGLIASVAAGIGLIAACKSKKNKNIEK